MSFVMSRFAPGLVVKMLKLAAFRYCKPECCTAVPLALHRCSELHSWHPLTAVDLRGVAKRGELVGI